jgi:hypothetical protein
MIVWLASYPHSGSRFLRTLLQQGFDLPVSSVSEITYSEITQSKDLHVVETHDEPQDKAKAIYLVRDPRDIIASARRDTNSQDTVAIDYRDVILGNSPFGSWTDHVKSWSPTYRANTLFLTCEELLEDLPAAIEKLAGFLGRESKPAKSVDQTALEELGVELSSHSYLTPEIITLIEVLNAEQMAKFGYLPRTAHKRSNLIPVIQELSNRLKIAHMERALPGETTKADLTSTDMLARMKRAEADAARARMSGAELAAELESLKSELDRAHRRLGQLHNVLAPRWKNIFSLKPLRFVIRMRGLVKSGHLKFDEHGIPVETGHQDHDSQHAADETTKLPAAPDNIQRKNGQSASFYAGWTPEKPLGIAVFAYDRAQNLEAVLESLKLQDALSKVHVFIDGDQGRPAKRQIIDRTEEIARSYDIAGIHRQRGNFGFRKMMILSIKRMFEMYEHALFLEDDCFPTRYAAKGFSCELTAIEKDDGIFSVYGHHFGLEQNEESFPRVQGWGWATTRDKMMSIWPDLRDCYMMSEDDYLNFVNRALTPDVEARLRATPGRDPLNTITNFFAWDETVALLTAMRGMSHRPSRERLIYNFGMGHSSTHFGANPVFRAPPFNMITPDEIWDHF